MKSPLKIIERMVKDYPNDMELGSKVRHYIYWLRETKSKKDQIMDYKYKYKLEVEEGFYEGDNLFFLICKVVLHRFWHLVNHGEWTD